MKPSSDGLYSIYSDCAIEVATGKTVGVWHPITHEPHPAYPETADFLALYGDEIAEPLPDNQVPVEEDGVSQS